MQRVECLLRQKTEMNLVEIKALIDAMAASDLGEMEFTRGDTSLKLVRRKALPAPQAPTRPASPVKACDKPEPKASSLLPSPSNEITAPLYGVVHWQPAPDAPPFVKQGQSIKAGQVVCVVEAMKVFNEIRAERDATVAALLVESGAEVEAGQPLLQLG